jgi:hypothetical protein
MGTLISYDGFGRQPDKITGRTYLTFGSQLGNLFVRGAFGGRVGPLDGAAGWYHLYNVNDHVFTAPLDFGDFRTASNFQQVETPFGSVWPWQLNHDAVNVGSPDHAYLTHPQTQAVVWPVVPVAPADRLPRVLQLAAKAVQKVPDAPTHRALLVGINNYPDPANRLEGCINDVFLMSSVLQECGFAVEDIRVVFDERATADGLVERLHWLLDGTAAGDQRFFYYSGHGALLPAYAADGKINHCDACLVPYDFAWTAQTALTDDRLLNFYSQLPYGARFMMVLDSCHSGGMTRGTGARVKGLDPPDDIRHRMLRWNARLQMWEPRELPPANPDLTGPAGERFVGASGATRRLGRAVALRTLPNRQYDKVRGDLGHQGPYLPMVYEACGEQELAFEYKHGVVAQGAFTYALAAVLRRHESAGQPVTFAGLLAETAAALQDLHYQQHPEVVGPTALLRTPIPWEGFGATGKP